MRDCSMQRSPFQVFSIGVRAQDDHCAAAGAFLSEQQRRRLARVAEQPHAPLRQQGEAPLWTPLHPSTQLNYSSCAEIKPA